MFLLSPVYFSVLSMIYMKSEDNASWEEKHSSMELLYSGNLEDVRFSLWYTTRPSRCAYLATRRVCQCKHHGYRLEQIMM